MTDTSLSNLALESIEENLQLAKHAIYNRKDDKDSGCYGVSAVILLSSILDSIGTFFCLDSNARSTNRGNNSDYSFKLYESNIQNWEHYVGDAKSHFIQIYRQYITDNNNYGFTDESHFINTIYKAYRCHLIHNLTLNNGVLISNLTSNTANVIEEMNYQNEKIVILHLQQYYSMVIDIVYNFRKTYGSQICNKLDIKAVNSNMVTGGTINIVASDIMNDKTN